MVSAKRINSDNLRLSMREFELTYPACQKEVHGLILISKTLYSIILSYSSNLSALHMGTSFLRGKKEWNITERPFAGSSSF